MLLKVFSKKLKYLKIFLKSKRVLPKTYFEKDIRNLQKAEGNILLRTFSRFAPVL